MMMPSPNLNGGHYNINNSPNAMVINGGIYNQNYATPTARTPQKYLKQFLDVNSNNENSEKSYVWKEIEQRLKTPRRNYFR
jgi:hypothetical protein